MRPLFALLLLGATAPLATVRMRRRDVIAGVGGAISLALSVARAQAQEKVPRIAFLGNSTATLEANLIEPFRDGLRELGYVEGRTIQIEYRWAEGDYSRFPRLVAELLASDPRVIVTAGTPAATAVAKATKELPCVMIAVGAPEATGLVASLAHPGGNMTGISSIAPELEGKRLALLREVVPQLSRLSVFWNPDNPFHLISKAQVQAGADALKIGVHFAAVRTSTDV